MSDSEHLERITLCAEAIAQDLDADVLLYNGQIEWSWETGKNLIDLCNSISRRPNVMLLLVTTGGDPDAAYRMARCLQQKYSQYIIFIPGLCMSAGSLLALGASEIVMTDHGQLGPLDMQIAKQDELWESGSALDTIQALNFLKSSTFSMFGENLVDLKSGSRNQITLKTATEIAASLTTGLYHPVYEQLDPTKLGEVSRAISIAEQYGDRLINKAKNAHDGALAKLVMGYPTHSFVIDREEAKELFHLVREPKDAEQELVKALNTLTSGLAQVPNVHTNPADPSPEPLVAFLSDVANADNRLEKHHEREGLTAENNDKGSNARESEEPEPSIGGENELDRESSQGNKQTSQGAPKESTKEAVSYEITREEVSYEATSTHTNNSESQ